MYFVCKQVGYTNIDVSKEYQEILLKVYAFTITTEHNSGMILMRN